jgi:hypothetical protein
VQRLRSLSAGLFCFLVIHSTLFFCYSDIIVFTIPKVFFVKFHFKLFQ